MENLRKKGIVLLKAVFSALLLFLVFDRIPFSEVWKILQSAKPSYLLLALLCFALSKMVAALRLNLYFFQVDLPLRTCSNFQLYLQGMFYNLFLPGGIGGDAYKGYVLHRAFDTPIKRLASVLILDRVSGLFLLFGFCTVLLIGSQEPRLLEVRSWAMLVFSVSLVVYWWIHWKLFEYLQPVFWRSLGYSTLVQFAQLVAVFFILRAVGVEGHTLEYLLVFLVSSIAAVLPVTLGGIGSREIVFYYGAQWLDLNQETAIGISVAFFGMTALVSLVGMIYHFRKPRLQLQDQGSS